MGLEGPPAEGLSRYGRKALRRRSAPGASGGRVPSSRPLNAISAEENRFAGLAVVLRGLGRERSSRRTKLCDSPFPKIPLLTISQPPKKGGDDAQSKGRTIHHPSPSPPGVGLQLFLRIVVVCRRHHPVPRPLVRGGSLGTVVLCRRSGTTHTFARDRPAAGGTVRNRADSHTDETQNSIRVSMYPEI